MLKLNMHSTVWFDKTGISMINSDTYRVLLLSYKKKAPEKPRLREMLV